MSRQLGVIPIIAGPTAVGKTSTSLSVALARNAEIISADSRQIYREFSIGTASPTREDCRLVRHHFVREIGIGDDFSAGIFASRVFGRIGSIANRGHNVLVTGGSTLYVHALIHGLSDIPAVDPEFRIALNQRLQKEGSTVLFDELVRVDPDFAETLDSSKSQRIIRGLEVFLGTGTPLSHFHTPPPDQGYRFKLFVLYRDRKILYERINLRVETMIKSGLLEELQNILKSGFDVSDNAFRTIGYQELIPVLDGEYSLQDGIELIKRNSRRYAKRQLTWYKRYENALWIDVDKEDATASILRNV